MHCCIINIVQKSFYFPNKPESPMMDPLIKVLYVTKKAPMEITFLTKTLQKISTPCFSFIVSYFHR